MSTTQRQAVITLIEKKNKDRRWIKNWRPVSLVNVDLKIGSKAIFIAKRLENVLPNIIHFNQNGFVKERNIFDAVRTVSDIFDFTQTYGQGGILTAVGFEKAFSGLKLSVSGFSKIWFWGILHRLDQDFVPKYIKLCDE